MRYYFGKANVKFKAPVIPGDQLRFEVEAEKLLSSGGIVQARAMVKDTVVAQAQIGFAVQKIEGKPKKKKL